MESVLGRLSDGGAAESAELWVLRERAVEQLDALVRSADEKLIARLAFAVIDGDVPIIILRVRPSKLAPPMTLPIRVSACSVSSATAILHLRAAFWGSRFSSVALSAPS